MVATRLPRAIKISLMLLVGFGVYALSSQVRAVTHAELPFELILEPLFICMVAGFWVTNFTRHRQEFGQMLRDAGPPSHPMASPVCASAIG